MTELRDGSSVGSGRAPTGKRWLQRLHLADWRLLLTISCATVLGVSSVALGVNLGGLAPPLVAVSIGVSASATPVPLPTWGLNVAPTHVFNVSDARLVGDTPARFLRFPGGLVAEWMNWTSGVLTEPNGTTVSTTTSIAAFVAGCETIGCDAILDLPAEIDEPSTAAYYVAYTESTLGFHPAYWEIGNEPAGWTHFGQPWSQWGTPGTGLTPHQYALLVRNYTAAIRQVDPSTPILGLAAGEQQQPTAWIPPLLALDGKELAGISIHEYPAVPTPVLVTPVQYFATLAQGRYAIPSVVPDYLSTIAASCTGCSLSLFLDEVGTSDGNPGAYAGYGSSFDGALYEAAEVTQLLAQRVGNVDWFTFQGGYPGAWVTAAAQPTPMYELFRAILDHLGSSYLPTAVTGYPGVYAAGTVGGSLGYSLLVVNTNPSTYVSFDLARAGFAETTVPAIYWASGTPAPLGTNFSGSALLAPLSVALLSGPLNPASSEPAASLSVSLIALEEPTILLPLGSVAVALGAATLVWVRSYPRLLGGAAAALGIILILSVI